MEEAEEELKETPVTIVQEVAEEEDRAVIQELLELLVLIIGVVVEEVTITVTLIQE
jgi:hypothetical protein